MDCVRIFENTDDLQLERTWVDIAHERDPLAEFHIELVGQILRNDAPGPVRKKSFALIFRHFHLRANRHEGFGFHSKAREEVSLVAILICAAVPVPDRDLLYARNIADLVFISDQDRLRQRNAVSDDQSQRLAGRLLSKKQSMIDRNQYSE